MNLYSSATVLALVILFQRAYPLYKLFVLHFGNHFTCSIFFPFYKMLCSKFSEKWNLQLSPTSKVYYLSFINCVNFPCSFVFHIYKVQVTWTKIAISLFLKIIFEAHLICYRIKFLSKSEICSKIQNIITLNPKLSSI